MTDRDFRDFLVRHGHELWRDMPWRSDARPYYVLVSELMLQQTQVARVVPKFLAFVERFPDEKSLADAPLAEVLRAWQGLGYNRRAKYLHDAAKMIIADFDGVFPQVEKDLLRLPGVGKNTAGAIQAYAFNQPAIFVETNIRTVYIHHFFADNFAVDDKEIIEKLTSTIDRKNPRRFYQNLMDYGAWLKNNGVRNNAHSKHHKKQSPLAGSVRELRGEIIRHLTDEKSILPSTIRQDARFVKARAGLMRDGLIVQTGEHYHLTK